MRDHIERYWRELADVTRNMSYGLLEQAAEVLIDCQRRGGTIFVLGNGGSAATASHFACDLAKGTRTNGQPTFRAVALNDNIPLLTAWANDTSYERVFAEQLVALIRPDDVVLAISASGNSPNVLAAARAARVVGVPTVALTGRSGGQLRSLADLTIRVPSDSIEQVEDAHLVIAHSLCVAMREHLREAALPLARVQQVASLEVGG
ncbi:MAG TPA: SIS domain-containing protein [Herpetosiphonaceae bacterium]